MPYLLILTVACMSFNAICENKILAKIFEYTVVLTHVKLLLDMEWLFYKGYFWIEQLSFLTNILDVWLLKLKKNRRKQIILYRGSYMSAHVLLNLLNEMGKKEIKCEACRAFYLFFATS